ncbi:MerR family transcriptional regulator [Lactococcus nasutitermitis]|uniref:MerR family transcriptional regulator n=1 Tax=Lactococcus nasutitermitis TaxID=1652957 RepID=A0ABV9JEE9_9LACT|nr:MerR family transcriptional regulator [Lactococcus nasutitermitis]
MNMKEMCAKSGLSANTIRYYEKEKLLKIPRNKSGYRDFSAANQRRLEYITKLRRAGIGIDFLRKYCALLDATDGKSHDAELRTMLIEQAKDARQRLTELSNALDYLDWKIGVYDTNLKILGELSKEK